MTAPTDARCAVCRRGHYTMLDGSVTGEGACEGGGCTCLICRAPASDTATLAEARRLASDAWTARTTWGRDDERTHRALHELLGFILDIAPIPGGDV